MFAHAALSKPLKVNAAVTSTVTRKTTKDSSDSSKKTKPVTLKKKTTAASAASTTTSSSTAKPVVTAAKARSTTSIGDAAAKASSSSSNKNNHNTKHSYSKTKPARTANKDNNATMVIGGCTTVAGTPNSWPKPHAVPANEKPTVIPPKKKMSVSKKSNHGTPPVNKVIDIADVTTTQEFPDSGQLHKDIDNLIPEMYRKKSAKQLEQEQQEEIQMMRRIMWELRRQEMEKEEQALQIKPITHDIQATLRALQNAKKERDMLDDHSSLDDSDATSKRMSAYSAHMRSKLAFFNSNHSAKLYGDDDSDSDDSDDSSSISSWDSDASDGLFRG